jgi:hypothetical protein
MKTEKRSFPSVQQRLARQRGASLLEGIAYLGIAALVVLGAVSLLTNAFGSAKANQTVEEVVALRTAVRKLYTGQVYTNGDLLPDLVRANAIPNTLVRAGNNVTNSWAGEVDIAGNGAGLFTITYFAVPQDVCMSVVSGANGWTQISNANAANAIIAFPVTAANAATACAAAANTLVFTAT